MVKKCFLCNAELGDEGKKYPRDRASEAWETGLQNPGMFMSSVDDYWACKACSKVMDRGRLVIWKLLGSLVFSVVFLGLTLLQAFEVADTSYWVIFRVGFVPVPVILLTVAGMLVAIYYFIISRGAMKEVIRRNRTYNEAVMAQMKENVNEC